MDMGRELGKVDRLWPELRREKRQARSALPPTSRRVFTRPSRVSISSLPPPLIGRRLGAATRALTSGRFSLSIPLVTCRRRAFAMVGFYIYTFGLGSLAAFVRFVRSSVTHSFVVRRRCCAAACKPANSVRLQVRVVVPGQVHLQPHLSQFRIARLLKGHLPE